MNTLVTLIGYITLAIYRNNYEIIAYTLADMCGPYSCSSFEFGC